MAQEEQRVLMSLRKLQKYFQMRMTSIQVLVVNPWYKLQDRDEDR